MLPPKQLPRPELVPTTKHVKTGLFPMIRKDYSFLVLNHIGSPIKRLSFSNKCLTVSGCILAAVFIAMIFLGVDYFSVRKSAGKSAALEKRIFQQKDVINHQKDQFPDLTAAF